MKKPAFSGGFVLSDGEFRSDRLGRTVLLDGFDLGDGQFTGGLVQGAGHLDRLGLTADFLVETLGDVAGQLVGRRLVAVLDLNNVLALVSLLEGALEALALAGQGDFLGESGGGQSGDGRNSENQSKGCATPGTGGGAMSTLPLSTPCSRASISSCERMSCITASRSW